MKITKVPDFPDEELSGTSLFSVLGRLKVGAKVPRGNMVEGVNAIGPSYTPIWLA